MFQQKHIKQDCCRELTSEEYDYLKNERIWNVTTNPKKVRFDMLLLFYSTSIKVLTTIEDVK